MDLRESLKDIFPPRKEDEVEEDEVEGVLCARHAPPERLRDLVETERSLAFQKFDDLRATVDTLRRENAAHTRRIAELTQDVARAREEHRRDLAARDDEEHARQKDVAALIAERRELEAALRRSENEEHHLKRIEQSLLDRIAILEADLQGLTADRASSDERSELRRLRAQHETLLEERRQEEAENRRLKRQNADLQLEVSRLKDDRLDLTQSLEKARLRERALGARHERCAAIEAQELHERELRRARDDEAVIALHISNQQLLRLLASGEDLRGVLQPDVATGETIFCGTPSTARKYRDLQAIVETEAEWARSRKEAGMREHLDILTLKTQRDFWVPYQAFMVAQRWRDTHTPKLPIESFYPLFIELNQIWHMRSQSRIKTTVEARRTPSARRTGSSSRHRDESRRRPLDPQTEDELKALRQQMRQKVSSRAVQQLFDTYHTICCRSLMVRAELEERYRRLVEAYDDVVQRERPRIEESEQRNGRVARSCRTAARRLDGTVARLVDNAQTILEGSKPLHSDGLTSNVMLHRLAEFSLCFADDVRTEVRGAVSAIVEATSEIRDADGSS